MPDARDVLTRRAPPPRFQVRYGQSPDHVADVWLPRSDRPAPLIVIIHGGFWRADYDRRHTGWLATALAAAGYVVASIEYRRVGAGGGWPTTFDDVSRALDTLPLLVSQAAPERVDPALTVHVGHSAGGHLAVWAASRHRLRPDSPWHVGRPDPRLRGVVSLAGVLDLGAAAWDDLDDGAARLLLGGDPTEAAARYATADPLRLAPAATPVVLVHGVNDDRVPPVYSERYAARAGNGAELVELPGTGHFELIDPRSAAWPAVLAAITRLVRPDVQRDDVPPAGPPTPGPAQS